MWQVKPPPQNPPKPTGYWTDGPLAVIACWKRPNLIQRIGVGILLGLKYQPVTKP